MYSILWDTIAQTMALVKEHDWELSVSTDRDPAVGHRGVIAPGYLVQVEPELLQELTHARGFGRPMQWDIEQEDQVPSVKRRVRLAA